MRVQRGVRPIAIAGAAMLLLAVAMLVLWASNDATTYGISCDAEGCSTADPVMYTLANTAIRLSGPLIGAGVLAVGAALALASVRGALSPSGSWIERRLIGMRALIALWVIAVGLVVASVSLTVWSSSPVAVGSSFGADRSSQLLLQIAYTTLPSVLLAGLVLLGVAIVATAVRSRLAVTEPEPSASDEEDSDLDDLLAEQPEPTRPWRRSDDLTPFMRPDDES